MIERLIDPSDLDDFDSNSNYDIEAHHAKLQINSTIADIFVPKKMRKNGETRVVVCSSVK